MKVPSRAFHFFALFHFFAPPNAVAQTSVGTLIVLNASDEEIVVAADSLSRNAVSQFDNRCKITSLGDQVIFASSGSTGYGPTNGQPLNWDAHKIAQNIFLVLSREKATDPMPIRLAKAWGKELQGKLAGDLQRDREGALFGVEGNTLTSAVFAGFHDGAPLIVTAAITYTEGCIPWTRDYCAGIFRGENPSSYRMATKSRIGEYFRRRPYRGHGH
jgi:hypothetical protein